MLLKLGVDISRLMREARYALTFVDALAPAAGHNEAVITSCYDGTHKASSLHYANNALDLRMPKDPPAATARLKAALGPKYDVVLESDHIHIEYDPKGT